MEVYQELKHRMHDPIPEQGVYLRSVVGGHIRYYGVPMNTPSITGFRKEVLPAVVEGLKTAKPQAPTGLGPDETSRGQVAPARPCLPSLSFRPSRRHYLRQEPYAEEPHVRVCAGGAG